MSGKFDIEQIGCDIEFFLRMNLFEKLEEVFPALKDFIEFSNEGAVISRTLTGKFKVTQGRKTVWYVIESPLPEYQ